MEVEPTNSQNYIQNNTFKKESETIESFWFNDKNSILNQTLQAPQYIYPIESTDTTSKANIDFKKQSWFIKSFLQHKEYCSSSNKDLSVDLKVQLFSESQSFYPVLYGTELSYVRQNDIKRDLLTVFKCFQSENDQKSSAASSKQPRENKTIEEENEEESMDEEHFLKKRGSSRMKNTYTALSKQVSTDSNQIKFGNQKALTSIGRNCQDIQFSNQLLSYGEYPIGQTPKSPDQFANLTFNCGSILFLLSSQYDHIRVALIPDDQNPQIEFIYQQSAMLIQLQNQDSQLIQQKRLLKFLNVGQQKVFLTLNNSELYPRIDTVYPAYLQLQSEFIEANQVKEVELDNNPESSSSAYEQFLQNYAEEYKENQPQIFKLNMKNCYLAGYQTQVIVKEQTGPLPCIDSILLQVEEKYTLHLELFDSDKFGTIQASSNHPLMLEKQKQEKQESLNSKQESLDLMQEKQEQSKYKFIPELLNQKGKAFEWKYYSSVFFWQHSKIGEQYSALYLIVYKDQVNQQQHIRLLFPVIEIKEIEVQANQEVGQKRANTTKVYLQQFYEVTNASQASLKPLSEYIALKIAQKLNQHVTKKSCWKIDMNRYIQDSRDKDSQVMNENETNLSTDLEHSELELQKNLNLLSTSRLQSSRRKNALNTQVAKQFYLIQYNPYGSFGSSEVVKRVFSEYLISQMNFQKSKKLTYQEKQEFLNQSGDEFIKEIRENMTLNNYKYSPGASDLCLNRNTLSKNKLPSFQPLSVSSEISKALSQSVQSVSLLFNEAQQAYVKLPDFQESQLFELYKISKTSKDGRTYFTYSLSVLNQLSFQVKLNKNTDQIFMYNVSYFSGTDHTGKVYETHPTLLKSDLNKLALSKYEQDLEYEDFLKNESSRYSLQEVYPNEQNARYNSKGFNVYKHSLKQIEVLQKVCSNSLFQTILNVSLSQISIQTLLQNANANTNQKFHPSYYQLFCRDFQLGEGYFLVEGEYKSQQKGGKSYYNFSVLGNE